MTTYTAYLKFKSVKGDVIIDVDVVTDELTNQNDCRLKRIDDHRYLRSLPIPPAHSVVEMVIVPNGDNLEYVYYYRDLDEITIFKDEMWRDLPAWDTCRYLALHDYWYKVHCKYWDDDATITWDLGENDFQAVHDVMWFVRHKNLQELVDTVNLSTQTK